MKKIVLFALVVLVVLFVSSCTMISTFPEWMWGSWDRNIDDEYIVVSKHKLVLHGEDFETTYKIDLDSTENETSKEKIFKAYLTKGLSIEAKLNKETGVLKIYEYNGILGGSYTKR